ncbi:MAG: hypothetical protein AAF066_03150 [Pseudomonadota bacterium]
MLTTEPSIAPTKKGALILGFRSMNICSVGGRGSSKTFTMMLDILAHCEEFGADARPIVLRGDWAGLLELQAEVFALCTKAYGARNVLRNKSDGTLTLSNGGVIQFSNIGDDSSYNKLQGRTFTAKYLDEAGVLSKAAWLNSKKVDSNLRVKLGMRAHKHETANPGGTLHSILWKERLSKAPYWQPYQLENGEWWVNVHSSLHDNPFIDQDAYIAQIKASVGGDPAMVDAWVWGKWQALGGGMFADVWDEKLHILAEAPPHALANYRYRIGCDWGQAAPSVGILLGETRREVRYDNGLYLPSGTIIGIDECDTVIDRSDLSKGDGSSPAAWAEKLKYMALQDNELRAVPPVIHDDARGLASETVIQLLQEAGIPAHKPRKKDRPGTWALLRQLLTNAKTGDGPGIFFTPKCQYILNTIAEAPRSSTNQNDICSKWNEDHGLDALGYGIRELKTQKARIKKMRGNF